MTCINPTSERYFGGKKKSKGERQREKERENSPQWPAGRETMGLPRQAATSGLPSCAAGLPHNALLQKGHTFH